MGVVTGIGRRPVSTVSAASRITLSPTTAGVDHAGVAQGLELVGGPGQGLACRLRRSRDDVPRAGVVVPRPGRRGLSGRAGHGEDRPLDRLAHCRVARVAGPCHGLGHHDGVPVPRLPRRDALGEGPQHLAEDDPAVAAGPQERTAAEHLEAGRQVGGRIRQHHVAEGVAGGRHGEVHVGAGVSVRHGIDVQGVDLLPGLRERVGGEVDEAQDDREPDGVVGGRFHGLPRRS